MASYVRAIQKTQTLGLTVTGAALAFYYLAPDLSVIEEVETPRGSLLAGVQPPSQSLLQGNVPSQDCYRLRVPASEFPMFMSPHPADGATSQGRADAAAREYARAVFQSFAFAPERWLLHATQHGKGISKTELAATAFPVGYKMGPFEVVEHAPGEILMHWTFPGRDFHGATWLAVRLPSEGVPSEPAQGNSNSISSEQAQGNSNSISSEQAQENSKGILLEHAQGNSKGIPSEQAQGNSNASTSGIGPDARDAVGGEGEGGKEILGEVEFLYGSAGWEEGAGKPRDVFGGLGGMFHMWYSKMLLWAGVQRLRKYKS